MNEKITVIANIGTQNGPSINLNREMEVNAYEKIKVDIRTGDTEKAVELWPSNNLGDVVLLAIVSSWYGDTLSYKVNDIATESFKLDQPHLLIGNSSVNMLNENPKKLKFSYTKPAGAGVELDVVHIQILVGLKNFDPTPP